MILLGPEQEQPSKQSNRNNKLVQNHVIYQCKAFSKDMFSLIIIKNSWQTCAELVTSLSFTLPIRLTSSQDCGFEQNKGRQQGRPMQAGAGKTAGGNQTFMN